MEHVCVVCHRIFATNSNLIRHLRKFHADDNIKVSPDKNGKICPLCSEDFISTKAIIEHLEKHDVTVVKECYAFSDLDVFQKWKKETEKEDKAMFTKTRGARTVEDGKIEYFSCHRRGMYDGRGKNVRNVKVMGSNKINAWCPASMKVSISRTGEVTVDYTKTHVGHNNELGRIRLSEDEKVNIASKLLNKIPISAILDDVRDSVADKLERIHLLTRRDVLNLKNDYNVCMDGKLHADDATSVDMWVHSMRKAENSPVVLYKAQSVKHPILDIQDFLLVLMNDSQRELLNLYGNDVVCLDFTHGVNSYNFDLATVLVLDDKREGFPGAFILSNRQDSVALKVAFEALYEHEVKIAPKVLMTDDTESFLNGWSAIFGSPSKWLLCSWHVDKNWRKKIQETIKDSALQAQTYKMLRCLLAETEEETFTLLLNQVIREWAETPGLEEFKTYFIKEYSRRPETWAFCYRKWAGVNTNMHLERLHRTVKYVYLQGKKVKRVDKALHCLMKFIRDKIFDRLITLEKGKVSCKISNLRKRHKLSLLLPVVCALKLSEEEWTVNSQSRTGEFYTVRRDATCSMDCALLCKDCKSCLHNFTCTCIDNSIQWNMCKHIHLVCLEILRNTVEEVVNDDSNCNDRPNLEISENQSRQLKDWEVDMHISNLMHQNTTPDTQVEILKKEITEMHSNMMQYLLPQTSNKLKEIHRAMKQFTVKLKAITEFEQIVPSNSFNKRTNEDKTEPPNTKIKKQRFFSTKKKNTTKSKRMAKPTTEEAQSLSLSLVLKSKSEACPSVAKDYVEEIHM